MPPSAPSATVQQTRSLTLATHEPIQLLDITRSVAALMVIPSGLLFGPSGGFHHHIGFGPFPFFYMVWNGEDPAPGSLQIVRGYEVWFNPFRFGILLVVWAVVFATAVGTIRPGQVAGSAPDAAPGTTPGDDVTR